MILFLIQYLFVTALFVALYEVFLAKSNHFKFNRWFLITGTLAPAIIALLPTITTDAPAVGIMEPIMNDLTFENLGPGKIPETQSRGTIGPFILPGVYLSIAGVLILRFLRRLYNLLSQKPTFNPALSGFPLVIDDTNKAPFSFWNRIYGSSDLVEPSQATRAIIKHEEAHLELKHSLDKLLMEVHLCLFFFNPMAYRLRSRMELNHEYQADSLAANRLSENVYLSGLKTFITSEFTPRPPASYHKTTQLKKRIEMIKSTEKSRFMAAGATVALAIGALVLTAFEPVNQVIEEHTPELVIPSTSTPSELPINEALLTKVSSGYGMRVNPINGSPKMHNGIDLIAPAGTPVVASGSGLVLEAEYSKMYGYQVLIEHSNNLVTRYAHLNSLSVKQGEHVTAKEEIGIIGNTGLSTGVHLHFEVRKAGEAVNPADYIEFPVSKSESE